MLVAKNRFKKCVHHLCNEPDLRDLFKSVSANLKALLRRRDDGLVRRLHLVDVHDEGGEQAVHDECGSVPYLIMSTEVFNDGCDHSSRLVCDIP